MSKAKRPEPLKIPLGFKQTVLAALETKPESKKGRKKKARPRPESSSER
jgi:hypothetical protein